MTIETDSEWSGGPVRVLYIAGIGRSGSTLLNRTLGSLHGFVAAGEVMHVFGRGMQSNELCACGRPFCDCPVWGEVVADLERELPAEPAILDGIRHRLTEGREIYGPFLPWKPPGLRGRIERLREVVGEVYRGLRESTGSRVVVDSSKSPAYARILIGCPDVRVFILHLVRDSRGVAHSLGKRKRRPGTDRPDELLDHRSAGMGSVLWSAANVLAESLYSRAEGFLRVRYEDFVTEPHTTARRVLDLLGEADVDGRVPELVGGRYELGAQHVLSGNPNRSQTGEIELREDLAWRRSMPTRRRWLVGGLTLPLLKRYGYALRRNGHHD